MNKNRLIAITLFLIFGILLSYKFYISNKKEVINEYIYLIKIKKRVEEINYLKNKYKIDLDPLKNICNIKSLSTKYILKCSNLDKNQFSKVEEIFKRAKISKFSIEKKDKVNVLVEIIK